MRGCDDETFRFGDKGDVRGILPGKGSLKDAANQIAQATGLHPSIETASAGGKIILVIRVEESRIKPVMLQGKAFKRSGSTTRQVGMEELTRMVLRNAGAAWDELEEPRAAMSDIDWTKVRDFIRLVKEKKRRPLPDKIQPLEFLKKLEFFHDARPTRAAVLLFGKNPQRFYGQVFLKNRPFPK